MSSGYKTCLIAIGHALSHRTFPVTKRCHIFFTTFYIFLQISLYTNRHREACQPTLLPYFHSTRLTTTSNPHYSHPSPSPKCAMKGTWGKMHTSDIHRNECK